MRASEHGGRAPDFVGRWSFNQSSDVWAHDHFATKEEAIAAGREYYGGEGFEVGLGAEVHVSGLDAHSVLERVAERAYEDSGEVAEDFLGHVPKEAVAELDAELGRVLAAWLTKHDEWPAFSAIERIEKVPPHANPEGDVMASSAERTPLLLVKDIVFFGRPAVLACDGNCRKAWGINGRPRVRLSDDPDDYAFRSDGELGAAPADPGTYEGGHAKPDPDGGPDRQNKWCARECERSELLEPGASVVLKDFSRRVRNRPEE